MTFSQKLSTKKNIFRYPLSHVLLLLLLFTISCLTTLSVNGGSAGVDPAAALLLRPFSRIILDMDSNCTKGCFAHSVARSSTSEATNFLVGDFEAFDTVSHPTDVMQIGGKPLTGTYDLGGSFFHGKDLGGTTERLRYATNPDGRVIQTDVNSLGNGYRLASFKGAYVGLTPPVQSRSDSYDGILLKYMTDLSVDWFFLMGGDSDDQPLAVKVDPSDDSTYVAVQLNGQGYIDTNLVQCLDSHGVVDVTIMCSVIFKLNSTGQLQWVSRPVVVDSRITSLTCDGSQVFAAGNMQKSAVGLFVQVYYSGTGQLVWRTEMINTGQNPIVSLKSIARGFDHSIYVGGSFRGLFNSNLGNISSLSSNSMFLMGFDADGTVQMVQSFGQGSSEISSVVTNIEGNIIIAGKFNGSITIGSTSYTKNETDGFVAKVTRNGREIWSTTVGGDQYDEITSMFMVGSQQGQIILAGNSASEIVFNNTIRVRRPGISAFVSSIIDQINMVSCDGVTSLSPSVCSGRGDCTSGGTCVCNEGYTGDFCAISMCFGVSALNNSVCSSHGKCAGVNTCVCNDGYTGISCAIPMCFGVSGLNNTVCSSHGACTGVDSCRCNEGYTGISCAIPMCFGVSALNNTVCSSHGDCVGVDSCSCQSGFSGPHCEFQVPTVSISSNSDVSLFNRELSWLSTANVIPVSELNNVNFEWSMTENGTMRPITELLEQGVTPTMRTISIQPNSLLANSSYVLRVVIRSKLDPNVVWGQAISIVQTGSAPTGGVFLVSPTKGYLLKDRFLLETRQWVDHEGNMNAMRFSFGYYQQGTRVVLQSWSTSSLFNVTLPIAGNITLFALARSSSGESAERLATVEVLPIPVETLTSVLIESNQNLLSGNKSELNSKISIVVAAVSNAASVLPSNTTRQFLGNIVQVMYDNRDSLDATSQIQAVQQLSTQAKLLTEQTTVLASEILGQSLNQLFYNSSGSSFIDKSINAAGKLAEVMIGSASSSDQRVSFQSMFSKLTSRVRDSLIEGEERTISMPNIETLISRFRKSNETVANITIATPNSLVGQNDTSDTSDAAPIVVHLNHQAIFEATSDPSIYTQAEAQAQTVQPYTNQCNTKRVSSALSLSIYGEGQNSIQVPPSSTPLFSSSIVVSQSQGQVNNSFTFVCKFFDTEQGIWRNDTRVCDTRYSVAVHTNSTVVICSCYKPVTHAVSLDYVISSTEEENGGNLDSTTCQNPCGCLPGTQQNRLKKLPPYAIALIVLGSLTGLIILTLGVGALVLLTRLVNRKLSNKPKRMEIAESNQIEMRFESMYK